MHCMGLGMVFGYFSILLYPFQSSNTVPLKSSDANASYLKKKNKATNKTESQVRKLY